VYVEIRGDRLYIGMVSVDPGRQGRGLGRALMAAAESYGRAAGCRVADITASTCGPSSRPSIESLDSRTVIRSG